MNGETRKVATMLELYHNNISVCSQKVRHALAEKELDWVGRHVGLIGGEQTAPDYLRLNPRALVPTLVHDGIPIIESTVINEYLDEVFAAPPLKPADPPGRARMRLWTKVPDEGIHVACASVSFAAAFARQLQSRFTPAAMEKRLAGRPDRARAGRQRAIMEHGFDAPFVRDAVLLFDRTYQAMEEALGDVPWLAGDSFSLADIALTPYLDRLHRLGLSPMWDRARPRLTDWFARIRARPSFDRAYTSFGPIDYDDLLIERGESAWPEVEPLLAEA